MFLGISEEEVQPMRSVVSSATCDMWFTTVCVCGWVCGGYNGLACSDSCTLCNDMISLFYEPSYLRLEEIILPIILFFYS